MMIALRKPYPSGASDEEWALVAPYLCLLREGAPSVAIPPADAGGTLGSYAQRGHSLREVFNGLRTMVKAGAPWRWMPSDLPPWAAVYQQARPWLATSCSEALAADLRAVLRLAAGRAAAAWTLRRAAGQFWAKWPTPGALIDASRLQGCGTGMA